MIDILLDTEQLLVRKKDEFLGDSKGRLRELLERIWTDKFKWNKSFTCCKMGMYNDLQEELEARGFFVFTEKRYGEIMFCVTWK